MFSSSFLVVNNPLNPICVSWWDVVEPGWLYLVRVTYSEFVSARAMSWPGDSRSQLSSPSSDHCRVEGGGRESTNPCAWGEEWRKQCGDSSVYQDDSSRLPSRAYDPFRHEGFFSSFIVAGMNFLLGSRPAGYFSNSHTVISPLDTSHLTSWFCCTLGDIAESFPAPPEACIAPAGPAIKQPPERKVLGRSTLISLHLSR